jgi:hypothetical protein
MIKKQCKECPWKVKSGNNTTITTFAKKHNKRHNCHMTSPKSLWDVNDKCMCAGSRIEISKYEIKRIKT